MAASKNSPRACQPEELTVATAAAAKAELLDAIDGDGSAVVDLSKVSEIDTAGVQLLVLMARETAKRGGRLLIDNPSPAVMDLVELIAVDRLLEKEGARVAWADQ